MSLHINRFVDKIRSAEGRRDREVTLTLAEARDLMADITRLLLLVEELRSRSATTSTEVTNIEISGGSF